MTEPKPLAEVHIATTIRQLPEHIAEYLGYDFEITHVCMDCGCGVGGQSLRKHARQHAGLPQPERPRRKDATR